MNTGSAMEEPGPQPKERVKVWPLARTLAFSLTFTVVFACGPSINKAIGEAAGWSTYSLATLCVGTLLFFAFIGGGIGWLSQVSVDWFGRRTSSTNLPS